MKKPCFSDLSSRASGNTGRPRSPDNIRMDLLWTAHAIQHWRTSAKARDFDARIWLRPPASLAGRRSPTIISSHDMPDFVLGDDKMFVGVYGEVKRANVLLEDLALSTEQNDQIGRYLARPTCGVLVYWRARRAILGLWFRAAGQASASKSPSLRHLVQNSRLLKGALLIPL